MRRDFDGKDYYQILGVSPEANPEEIKKAYRQLALRFHPDRNPGDKKAEERFKEVSEAYGVLIDPEKRQRFNAMGGAGVQPGAGGFSYTQEDIFRELFQNPMASDVFAELSREFSRTGLRFDERFFDQLFFNGRGIFIGGFFFGGPGGFHFEPFRPGRSPAGGQARASIPIVEQILAPGRLNQKGGVFSWLVKKGIEFLWRRLVGSPPASPDDLNLVYNFSLRPEEVTSSATKEFSLRRNGATERLLVKIPAGVQDGTLIRLKGKGNSQGGKVGDLYLKVKVEEA